ncbi:hypothetical protein TM48_03965 [Mycobacterium shottsii]|nr:hypothetical protein TM48_03965 [Mycobacterium shottsii]
MTLCKRSNIFALSRQGGGRAGAFCVVYPLDTLVVAAGDTERFTDGSIGLVSISLGGRFTPHGE